MRTITTVRAARTIAVVAVAGTAVALAGAGVGYAAGSSSTAAVKACVNSKSRLALLSSSGKCAKGFKVVAINKQGPTGKTGKTGATGKTGPAGPGARQLHLDSNGSGGTTQFTVGSFGYRITCDTTATSADVRVYIEAKPGITASLSNVYNVTTGSSTTPTTKVYRTDFTGETSFHNTISNDVQRLYVDGMRIVGSDGSLQLLSVDVTADGRATPAANRCIVNGAIVPTT